MRIAFGTDEPTPLTAAVVAELERHGHEVSEVARAEPWPDVGRRVGEAVASPVEPSVAWCAAGPVPACRWPPTRCRACGRRCAPTPRRRGARGAGTTPTCSPWD